MRNIQYNARQGHYEYKGRRIPMDCVEAMQDNRIIDAIKAWRDFSGESLLESKNWIEEIMGRKPAQPERKEVTDEKLPREELLLKLLNMTTSDNDNIATISIRKANALLESAGWTWEKLLKGKITVVEDPFKSAGAHDPFARDARVKNSPDAPQPYRPAPPPPPRPQRTPPQPPPRPTPPPPPPKPTVNRVFPVVDSTKRNRYPGTCYCCATNVAVDAGFVFNPSAHNPSATDKWEVICDTCNSATTLTIPNRKAKAPQWQNPNASQTNPNLADL